MGHINAVAFLMLCCRNIDIYFISAFLRKIWKKLESQPQKSEAYLGTGFWGSAGGGAIDKKDDPGSDDDDSDKWNWYIS